MEKDIKNTLSDTVEVSIRENAMEWLFSKTKEEQQILSNKYYPFVWYSDQRWFHFSFFQIEEMYKNENKHNSEK